MTSRKTESKFPMGKSITLDPPAPIQAPIQVETPIPIVSKPLIGMTSMQHILGNQSDFLKNFDPQNSRRGQQKRKRETASRCTSLYDEFGRIRQTKQDICDCFDFNCPGCHNFCENCRSQKCGLKCRVSRKWTYEIIEHDGKDLVLRNPLVTTGIQRI